MSPKSMCDTYKTSTRFSICARIPKWLWLPKDDKTWPIYMFCEPCQYSLNITDATRFYITIPIINNLQLWSIHDKV